MENEKNNSIHGIVKVLLFIFGITLIGWLLYLAINIGLSGSSSNLFSGDEDLSEFQFLFWSTIVLIILFFITRKNK